MGVTAKPSGVQSSASSGTIPDFPNFAPGLIEASGGQETNAEIQGWWNVFKFQVLQQNNNLQNSIRIVATATGPTGTLQAEIDEERIVRADADQALADDIVTVEASIAGVVASVTAEAEARATADGHLSANYSITVTAGSVVTGMQLNSSSGGGVTSSTIDFQAANFRIWDGTGTAYPIFSTSVGLVKLASTLTVNTAGKVFTGVGTYGNNNTPFYVDSSSNFSLGSGLTWNGTTLTIAGSGTFSGTITATAGSIGGWTINATTISRNNAVLDSAGNLALGTANDIVIISATDTTYRLWVGNVTAGSAAFSVSKTGAMTSTSGTIGGFSISTNTLSVGSGNGFMNLDTPNGRIQIGASAGQHTYFQYFGILSYGGGGLLAFQANANDTYWYNAIEVVTIHANGFDGDITLTSIHASAGSAGSPSISINGDSDTGAYSDEANKFKVSAGGHEVARFVWDGSNTFLSLVSGTILKLGNTKQAITSETLQYYVTASDNAGTTIKLAIVA